MDVQPLPLVLRPLPKLPTPAAPGETDIPHLAKALEMLDLHQCQDVVFPLRYSAVGLDPKMVAEFVGQEEWVPMYADKMPGDDADIPPRILGCLRMALSRAALSYSVEKVEALAKARISAQPTCLKAVRSEAEHVAKKRARRVASPSAASQAATT